jgi:glucose-6-phosphate-specific signal transduction histidine kinase
MLSRYAVIKVLTASSVTEKGVKRDQMMLEVSDNGKTQPEKHPEHD